MKKKLLPILLVVVIVFNFIFCNGYVYADESSKVLDRTAIGNTTVSSESVSTIINDGTDSNGTTFSHSNFGTSIVGMIMQYIAMVINIFPMAIQGIITLITMIPEGDSWIAQMANGITGVLVEPSTHLTVEKIVFNEISLFNINAFNTNNEYKNGIGDKTESFKQHNANITLKKSATTWFYTCRLLAMMINLCILIYVGIRMALSTVASEEAKYKKMLIYWAESMILLFLLHYVMLAIVSIGEIALNLLYSIRTTMLEAGEISFESTIMTQIYNAFSEKAGMQLFMYSLFFWFLTWIQLKFFFSYFKRLLTVMFLTIIGPFITVTYPIDKLGDGKAQAFDAWSKEYIINVAIQPIHAGIYLVFVYTAGKIASQAPFVAMIFLLSLGKVENIVRNVFNLKGTVSMKNVDEEMRKKK